jgi:ABC-2 type transport system permease protein
MFSHGGMIAGYTLPQMIWYCIIAELISFSGSNIFQDLNAEIKGGNIAYTLNKPYYYIGYQLANASGIMLFKLFVNTILGILLGILVIGPLAGFQLQSLPLVALAVLNGLLLNFLILTCLGLTAFWLEENTAFFWIYQKIVFMLGLLLPIEFLPNGLQKVARVMPFAYITYGPAKLTVDFNWVRFREIIGMQLFFIIVFGVGALAIFRKGVKQLNVNGG